MFLAPVQTRSYGWESVTIAKSISRSIRLTRLADPYGVVDIEVTLIYAFSHQIASALACAVTRCHSINMCRIFATQAISRSARGSVVLFTYVSIEVSQASTGQQQQQAEFVLPGSFTTQSWRRFTWQDAISMQTAASWTWPWKVPHLGDCIKWVVLESR